MKCLRLSAVENLFSCLFCLFVVVVIVVIFLLSYDSNLRMFMDGVFLMKRNAVSEFNKRIGLD